MIVDPIKYTRKLHNLSDEHRREIVEGSGVPEAWVEGRYFSATAAEAR